MTTKQRINFGAHVRFQTLSGREADGIFLGEPYADNTLLENSEREYMILYRGDDGEVEFDSSVAQCWVSPNDGWIDPEDSEALYAVIRCLVDANTREAQTPAEE